MTSDSLTFRSRSNVQVLKMSSGHRRSRRRQPTMEIRDYTGSGRDVAVSRARRVISPDEYEARELARVSPYLRTSGFYGLGAREKRFLDSNYNFGNVVAVGERVTSFLDIAAGTGESDRQGRKICLKGMNLRIRAYVPPAIYGAGSNNGHDVLRCVLVLDKQTNGALANVTDVLESGSIFAFNNLVNRGRFRTLMDHFEDLKSPITWNGTNDYVGGKDVIINKYFKFKKPLYIEYSSTTGGIAERASNSLFLMMISENGICNAHAYFRVRFTDA